jgi:hypothetical protein
MAAAVDGSAVAAAAATNTNPAAANGTPAQQPPASGTAASAPAPPWYAGIEDSETRGYIENKAWKSPVEAIKSYRELESTFSKVRGAPPDRLVVLPGPDAKPEDYAPVYDKLGRPKTPEDYKLVGPDGTSTDPLAQKMAPVLHTYGATLGLAKAINETFNQHVQELITQQAADNEAKVKADLLTLHQEWPGQVYDERMALAKRAAESYGVSEEWIDKLHTVLGAEVFRFFARIGEGQGEGGKGFARGNASNTTFGLTPEGAAAQIEALKADKEFGKKLLEGNVEAKERLERLQLIRNARATANIVR